ncbi:DUF4247 domain-containing protein [Streptomyces sp. TRM64462]|uniref:DUF4247 domain-containing protein n=1 Tax=Streptomyces sp. TRM64462 TaxID=2741726 RepID=UPI0015869842|nr:DUF4247 domain-containing protein [Streptomyces sp. TRM64462]
MKNARRISAMLLATAALAACSSEPEDGNDVPSSWIRSTYTSNGVDYVDRTDPASRVAREIDGHTAAQGRITDGDKEFLRYRNDIVAITPRADGGSRIEIADYRSGYRRWKSHIRTQWPDPDGSAFRGGGPGSGK